MREVVSSNNIIRTDNAGIKSIITTYGDSSFLLENPQDEKICHIEIEDQPDLEIKICFWQTQKDGHVGKEIYTIKKDGHGGISLFDGSKNLLEEKQIEKEKIKIS